MASLKEALAAIIFALRYDDMGDEDDDTWDSSVYRWETIWRPALAQKHSGDCTYECHSCLRCQAEDCVRLAITIAMGLGDDG